MGSPWTVVKQLSMGIRHPVANSLHFTQLIAIEVSPQEQRQSILSVRESIEHCLREHFYEQRETWTS